ncbi:MAG: M15 family metallopeptidase, partial [Streptosporangiaceae bacterium]
GQASAASPPHPAVTQTQPAVSQTQPVPASAPPAVPRRRHKRRPVFTATVSGALDRSQVRYSWHPGCPVAPSALRMITMTYRGFDHKVHTGRLVVNAAVTGKLILVFRKLFAMRFPIRRMVPVDAYHGSDFASIQADNTSSFNCRDATGSSTWSEHAYGLAVDLDPCENPYVYADGYEAHKRCRKYVDRSLQDPGIIHAGDQVVLAFTSVGWGWGGIWPGDRDYQHFSANGR